MGVLVKDRCLAEKLIKRFSSSFPVNVMGVYLQTLNGFKNRAGSVCKCNMVRRLGS